MMSFGSIRIGHHVFLQYKNW